MPTPSAAVQRVTLFLKGVKATSTGWVARCPAHDDKVQSLSIGVGHEGRALINCHAGCSTEAVLSAVGLTVADLFVPPLVPISSSSSTQENTQIDQDVSESSPRKVVAEYVYQDQDGKAIYCVRRYDPKAFRRFHVDERGGWSPGTEGYKALLYRLPELSGTSAVVIVEGEKDADRLWSLGIPATTSGGATSWRPELVDQLKRAGVKHVAIIPDNDTAGISCGNRIARDCHDAGLSVRLVLLREVPEKGDVSDWLDTGHNVEELRRIINGTPLFTESPQHTRRPLLTKLSTVRVEPIDWLWHQRLARRKITLWAGDPGGGKSYASLDIASRLSRGSEWPDGTAPEQPGSTLVLAAEDGVRDTIAARFGALYGDPERLTVLEGYRTGEGPGQIWSVKDVDVLDQALEETKADLVIIDPLMAYMAGTDTYKDSDIRSSMAPMVPLIEKHNAALLVIMHLNKNDKSRAIYRVGGSVAFVGLARLGFLFGYDPKDQDRRVMAPVKANICQAAPSWAFRITDQGVEWEAHSCYLDASQILKEPKYDEVSSEADDCGRDTVRQQARSGKVSGTRTLAESWYD